MNRNIYMPACLVFLLTVVLLAFSACGDVESPSVDDTTRETTQDVTEASTEPETMDKPTVDTTAEPETTAPITESDTTEKEKSSMLYLVEPGQTSTAFTITYDRGEDNAPETDVNQILMSFYAVFGVIPRETTASVPKRVKPCEIVVGSVHRDECVELTASLSEGEYAVKVYPGENEGEGRVVIAYTDDWSRMLAVDFFTATCLGEYRGCLPMDFEARGACPTGDSGVIMSDIEQMRDPCILVVDGVYYAYGTGWTCYKNTTGDLAGHWENVGHVVTVPEDVDTDLWAPEVYAYNGAYYMFTTYKSKSTGHRGCTVMRSDFPEGPFEEVSDGHVTPADWDAIDGTLYIDPDGQPWMVFVHEWTSTDDGIGRFAAAKLSDDLTSFISEPIELFAANDPIWTDAQVTDGCWMYTTEDGQLLMLWSNFETYGYCVGIARSVSGRIDGEWTQDNELLYAYRYSNTYDGGHGMIFTALDGQMYLSIHSPQRQGGDGMKETPTFIPLKEKDGTLVWTYVEEIKNNLVITGTFPEEKPAE